MVHSRSREKAVDYQRELGTGARGTFRRARGVVLLAALGGAAGLLVWAGCSSDSSDGGNPNAVDPGGTYGAEITINVIGRGSVASDLPGLSCPGSCFKRYAFKSAADVGATTGVKLKSVITTERVRFAGWKLEPTPVGARGRGPDNCNPVVRDSTVLTIDPNAAEIMLPFGTSQGRAPVGQEGACGGYLDVPTSYTVTATFEDIPIPDAGVDADDGGGPDLFYDKPVYNGSVVGDAVGKEIGITLNSSSYLYWRWTTANNMSGVSRATTSGGGTPVVVVPPTKAISILGIDYHVVYQTNDGVLHVIQAGGNLPLDLPNAPGACVAVASDSTYVYCRTASTGADGGLYKWTVAGVGPTPVFTNLPPGSDLWVDPINAYVYLTDTSGGAGAARVLYTPQVTIDGGYEATFSELATSLTSPSALRGNSSRIYWLQNQGGGAQGLVSLNKTSLNQTPYVAFPLTAGINRIAVYASDSTYFWVASANEIDRAYYSGASALSPIRTGLNNVGGLTVDSSYAYWTTQDGRVFRRSKN